MRNTSRIAVLKTRLFGLCVILPSTIAAGYGINHFAQRLGTPVSEAHVDALMHDFGSVRAGEVIRHSFSILNASESATVVKNFHSACGCTVVGVESQEIPANGSVEMPVTLDTSGKSGEITQPVVVELGNGTFLTYKLHGFVVDTQLEPIEFGTVLRGASVEKEVVLRWPPGLSLDITELIYRDDKLRVRYETRGRSFHFAVGIVGEVPFGPLRETVRIRTTDRLTPEQSFNVFAMIAYPISLEPDQIALGLVKTDVEATGRARIYSPYGQAIKIEQIEHHGGLPVTWSTERSTESEIILGISLNANSEQTYYKSVLRVTARTEEELRTFDVEIYGVGTSAREALPQESGKISTEPRTAIGL